jgi:hypothetical protein
MITLTLPFPARARVACLAGIPDPAACPRAAPAGGCAAHGREQAGRPGAGSEV